MASGGEFPAFRAILFDIGRVIVRVDVACAAAPLGQAAGLSPTEIWHAIETDPQWPDWQEGRMTPRQWHSHLSKRFGVGLEFEEFCALWNQSLRPRTILDESLFAVLGAHFRLALLSNTDPIHIAHMESSFPFMRHFPPALRVYSCAVGATKPSPRIYAKGISVCGLPAAEILYVDDVAEFVEAGRRAGMQGIRFVGPTELIQELECRGLAMETAKWRTERKES